MNALVWTLCRLFSAAELKRLSKKLWYAAAELEKRA